MAQKKEEKKSKTVVAKTSTKKPANKKPATNISKPQQVASPKIESLALVHHVHNTKHRKSFFVFPGHFIRLEDYLKTDPTLWQMSWSILWRVFILIQVTKLAFVVISSILMTFFADTIMSTLINIQ